jgi:protein-disulfide isomerase
MTYRKKLPTIIAGIVLVTLFCAPTSFAQQKQSQSNEELKALKKEIEAVKEGQTAIQKQLQEIKVLLKTRPVAGQPAAPRQIVMDIANKHVKGEKSAKVVVVEFSDYQCPFCARFVRDTIPQVETEYIKTGKIQYVFGDFPLETIHPLAFKAAEAASCAADQGKYWEMHDELFANQKALKPTDLPEHANSIGLDKTKFQQCLDTGENASSIRKVMAQAAEAGVTGTPTLMVGLLQPNSSKVKVLRTLKGAQPFAAVKDAIDNALAAPNQ